MKTLKRSTLRAIFEEAIDGNNSNAFRHILSPLRTYASLAAYSKVEKNNDNAQFISILDLELVLSSLSKKWEREIDKIVG